MARHALSNLSARPAEVIALTCGARSVVRLCPNCRPIHTKQIAVGVADGVHVTLPQNASPDLPSNPYVGQTVNCGCRSHSHPTGRRWAERRPANELRRLSGPGSKPLRVHPRRYDRPIPDTRWPTQSSACWRLKTCRGRGHLQQPCCLAHITTLSRGARDTLHLDGCRPWPAQPLARRPRSVQPGHHAIAEHRPLELREPRQHAEQHPAGWGRGIEGLLVRGGRCPAIVARRAAQSGLAETVAHTFQSSSQIVRHETLNDARGDAAHGLQDFQNMQICGNPWGRRA